MLILDRIANSSVGIVISFLARVNEVHKFTAIQTGVTEVHRVVYDF